MSKCKIKAFDRLDDGNYVAVIEVSIYNQYFGCTDTKHMRALMHGSAKMTDIIGHEIEIDLINLIKPLTYVSTYNGKEITVRKGIELK